jgi:hypothetical protein
LRASGGESANDDYAAELSSETTTQQDLRVEPQLSPDPEVMKIVDELDDNQPAWLPQKSVVGDFDEFLKRHKHHITGPRTRNYCYKP